MRLSDWLDQATHTLKTAGILSAQLDSELLAGFVLKQSRTWLHGNPEYVLTTSEHNLLNSLLERRTGQEPIAYIIGSKEFYGREFAVSPDVLVPRPESENLIDIIKTLEVSDIKFIDIGTGSGCLAITTALEQPTWSGTATDISQEALNVAKQNAKKFEAKNLVFKVQNLLADDATNYNVIIANLPYVAYMLHGKSDIKHEPDIALFADHDGLALYEELFQQIGARTSKPAHILTESLKTQHQDLQKIAKDAGYLLEETKGLIQHYVPVS
jgi:release factor glutamine methyltransferase